ncbi:MAG: aldehyde ferredoxin oxidoreductase N-terminal domain-containing protein [Thermodesulfobacteriota bacterium]|nr:aldehyde ferredoxin oxidoreductase N-terminal domain-containing protein [Thermodesulfobacteriota bacterium]
MAHGIGSALFWDRFEAMLKYAGWDGIVIDGKADRPVWIDIQNEDIFKKTLLFCGDKTHGLPRKRFGVESV